MLALPSVEDPQATVFQRGDGQWLVELGSEARAIADRDRIEVGEARWLMFLPGELGPLPETLKAQGAPFLLGDISLRFIASLDEEHVDVCMRMDDGKESVLPPRSSYYMLLTLARARIRDAASGVVPQEQGWLYSSDLAEMLRYTAERLNLDIFRIRSLLAKLGCSDSANVIERRVASRQLRIGIDRLEVTRG
jgi:hypothetical protein